MNSQIDLSRQIRQKRYGDEELPAPAAGDPSGLGNLQVCRMLACIHDGERSSVEMIGIKHQA
jgi:hypothetical protein